MGKINIEPVATALTMMDDSNTKNINGLFIIDEQGQPVGALNMLDMLKAGVV